MTLYHTADAVDFISDSGCKRLHFRQQMKETISDSGCKRLYQTADARVSILDSDSRIFYIRQQMPETLYQTVDALVSLSDSGCMQVSLYQTADERAGSLCKRLYITQRIHEPLY